MQDEYDSDPNLPYLHVDELDFSIITMGMKKLPFFEDDLYLGMQAMHIGIADPVITDHEYTLLVEYNETEKTPMSRALTVSALSQMWIFALYEVLRMWRDRRYQFKKLHDNGGIGAKIDSMSIDELENLTLETRKEQLERFGKNEDYRNRIEETWLQLEPIYRLAELFRMNLAKHCAPGKDGLIPRAPGYGRINRWCGAMDYELIVAHAHYEVLNRRDVADALRAMLLEVKQG